MLVCVSAGHSVAVIHDVSCPGSWRPGSWFLAHGAHGLIGVVWRSETFIALPGAIVPDRHAEPLATPYSAVYGVWLASSRGVPVVVWGGVALLPPAAGRQCCRCRVVGHCLQWGGVDGGYSPTIGVPPTVGMGG